MRLTRVVGPNRLVTIAVVLLISTAFLSMKCGTDLFQKHRIVVVMLDVSGSIPARDWDIYTRTFEALLDSGGPAAEPGNRLVLGSISGQTLSTFIPDADTTFPNTGITLDDMEQAVKISHYLKQKFQELRGLRRRAQSTNLFETLKIAEDLFKRDRQGKDRWLVLLSDMIEESRDYDFKSAPPADPDRIIEAQRSTGVLPSLQGVKVYVAGAGGASNYDIIKSFWLRYFKEAGASCDERSYGRSAITVFE